MTPDQVSQDVIKQLSDHLQSPGVAPERRANLDAHIRSRMQAELEYLRNEEEHVRQEIESALERENLSRERVMAGDVLDDNTNATGAIRSSVALLGDLDQIRSKVDRFHARKKLEEFSKVETTNGDVISCYKWVAVHASHPAPTAFPPDSTRRSRSTVGNKSSRLRMQLLSLSK